MTDGRQGPSAARMVLELGGAVLGIVMVAAAPNPPATSVQWAQVLVGATLSAGITILAGLQAAGRHRTGEPTNGSRATSLRDRRAVLWLRRRRAALFALLLLGIVGGVAGPPVVELLRGLSYQVGGCPPATQLRMVAEPETLSTAREVAKAYERASAGADHGCPAVQVFVFGATAATVARRLESADGWSDASGALRQVGPRPDVWLASTGHEVDALPTGNGPGPVADRFPVAHSPLVLAVTQAGSTARAGAPGTAQPDVAWPELLRRTTDAGTGVARPDPSSGELGKLATALLYGPGDGSGDADPAAPPPLSPDEVERRLDSALDDAGLPIGDAADLLCRRRAAPPGAAAPAPPAAAIITSEQDVARFNKGLALGDSCDAADGSPPPDRRLVALYPTDTGNQDLQFVRLAWDEPAGGPARQRAAVAFGEWLRGDGGRDALVGTGLRPVGAFARADPLTPEFGVDPTRSPSAVPVPAARRQTTEATYRRLQRPSHLLFVLDTSRSMTTQGPDGTRAQAAAAAVRAGLRRLGPRDEFGLWLFPAAAGTGATGTGATGPVHTDAVPLGPRTDARLAAAGQALDAAVPSGSTPLFRTMIDGVAALSRDGGAEARALVVLTDGEDTTSAISAVDTARAVADRGVRIVVVTLGEIRCSGGGLPAVVDATGGDCVDTDTVTVGAQLPEVVARLRGGG